MLHAFRRIFISPVWQGPSLDVFLARPIRYQLQKLSFVLNDRFRERGMKEYLIAQKYTTSDPWTLFIGGEECYSHATVDSVVVYLRSTPDRDNPSTVRIAIKPLTETEARKDPGAANLNTLLIP
jgi:hypothetical protein